MALSNEKNKPTVLKPEKQPERKISLVDDLIEKNKEFSSWFDRKVEELDLFLVGKASSSEKNTSSIKVINTIESHEAENFKNNVTISINPKLANLEKFLKIRLSTYVERDEYLRSKRNLKAEDQDPFEEENQSDDFWHDILTFRSSFEPRIELRDPLKVSYSVNFNSHGEYKAFSLDPKIELFADATKGVGIHHAINYSFNLNEEFDLRFLNEAEYQDRLHLYSIDNGMTLNQVWDAQNDLGYGFVVSSTNQPNYQLTSYRVFTSWQRVIYRRVLDLQLVPQVEFATANNYKGVGGFVFNIIVSF